MAEVAPPSRFRAIFFKHLIRPIIALAVATWAVWAMYGGASDPLEEVAFGLGIPVFLLTWGIAALVAKVIRDW
jgi:hypothetical protein